MRSALHYDIGGPHRFGIGDAVTWWGEPGTVIALTSEPSVTIEFVGGRRLTVGQSVVKPA